MSNLLEYISGLRKRGFSDYEILMAAKMKDQVDNEPQYGGNGGTTGDDVAVQDQGFENIQDNPAMMGEFGDVGADEGLDITGQDAPPDPLGDDVVGKELIPSAKELPPDVEQDVTSRTEYTTIPAGTILYHPSSTVRQISNDHTIFVNIDKVLDSGEKRAFTMFFTPNREYARRFSGISSLNKRNVYVHKLRVKNDVTGIRRINSKLISQETDNEELASGFCGPNADLYVNGIELTYETTSGDIKEYYVCNPENFFSLESTEMMFDATTWVDITEGEKIFVPEEGYLESDITEMEKMEAESALETEAETAYEAVDITGNVEETVGTADLIDFDNDESFM